MKHGLSFHYCVDDLQMYDLLKRGLPSFTMTINIYKIVLLIYKYVLSLTVIHVAMRYVCIPPDCYTCSNEVCLYSPDCYTCSRRVSVECLTKICTIFKSFVYN